MKTSSRETNVQNNKKRSQRTAQTDQSQRDVCQAKAAAVSNKTVAKLKPDSIRYLQRSIHDYICQAMRLDKEKNKLLQQAEYLSNKLHGCM